VSQKCSAFIAIKKVLLVAIHDPMKDFEAEVVEQLVRSEVESRVEGKLRPLSTITDKNHHRYQP
jgi:hypothetical protein